MTTQTKDSLATITIHSALSFPEGTPIPRIVGKLTHIFAYKSGEGDFGPYTSQSGVIADESGTNKILFTIWNKPSIPEDYMGRTLIFRSGAGKKPSMTLKSDFKDSSKRTLNVTKSCHVLTEEEDTDNIPMDYSKEPEAIAYAVPPKPAQDHPKHAPTVNLAPKNAIPEGGLDKVRHRLMQYVNLRKLTDAAAEALYGPEQHADNKKDVSSCFFIQALREGLADKLDHSHPIPSKPTKNKPEDSEPEFLPAEEF